MEVRERLRELVHLALANLEAHRRRIDDLNVYPVPDGDTGTNLTFTVRALAEALDDGNAPADRRELAAVATRAALYGAQGNSGVILSQIVRGVAEVLGSTASVDASAVAAALRAGSDAAYARIPAPVEGTILTVVREMAEEAGQIVPAETVVDVLRRVVSRGELALARTPELLPVLAQAGVVDAGGAGLLELARGVLAGLTGEPLETPDDSGAELSLDAIHLEASRFRYCTGFIVEGTAIDLAALQRDLSPLGDSLLVVGDPTAAKVHLHTDDPGAALTLAARAGVLERVSIANMHRQAAERDARLEPAVDQPLADARLGASALVAVAAGAGARALFEGYGAVVVEGGQSMNPSTADIAEAIERLAARETIVLPNNRNVILSAHQAVELVAGRARVIPTRSVQEGLVAAAGFISTRSADENESEMTAALRGIVVGEITTASRDAELDGIGVAEGDCLGLVGGDVVASAPSFDEVADVVCERLLDGGNLMLTALTGETAPQLDGLVARIAERHPAVEVEVVDGGQPHYPLLLWSE